MLAFFDEVLGQLQPHHQFPDLGASKPELALLRLATDAQAAGALLEEHALPTLQLVRRHLALPRDASRGLPPARAGASAPSCAPRFTAPAARAPRPPKVHCQESTSAWVFSSSTSFAAVIVVETVSKEIGSGLGGPSAGAPSTARRCRTGRDLASAMLELPRRSPITPVQGLYADRCISIVHRRRPTGFACGHSGPAARLEVSMTRAAMVPCR